MHGVNIKMKLLCRLFGVALPSHVTGRKFTSSQYFLVYWKTENISLYFYFPAYFSKLSFVWLATTGDVYSAHVTENWLPRIVRVFQSQTTAHALSQHWCARNGLMWCWHFLRRVWFYCEVNRMNSDRYIKKKPKKNTTMCFLETDTWLCPLQKQLEETGKPCVMVSLLVTPLWHGQLLDVTGSGGAMWEPVTVLSQCLAVALLFLIN